jgi:hypothetical protein
MLTVSGAPDQAVYQIGTPTVSDAFTHFPSVYGDTRIFGGGVFQFTFDPSVNLLHANFNTLTATATNGEGSYTEIGTLHLVPPATPPAPSDASVVNGYVNAAYDTAHQMLTGTAENGSTVTIYDNNVQVGTPTADATSGYWSFPIGMLADDSTHSYTVTATAAGSVSQQSTALSFVVDTDAEEQGSLQLTAQTISISAATAALVPFTIAGLESEDTGTVTFTDINQKSVAVNVTGGQTSYTANLSSLADGTITSSLSVNTDAAGNSFTAVPGNSVSLDRDAGEQMALKLTVNGGNPISPAIAVAVPFTVVGIESDDNGTVSFSDGSHAPVSVNIVNGVLSATTVNLSELNDGMITATLHLNNDAAGNPFTNVVTNATLDQDKVAEAPTVTAPSALTVAAGGSVPLGIVIKATDVDDVLSVAVSGVPRFESVSAAGAAPTITKQGSTYIYTFSALPTSDWNNGLILTSTYGGKGHPINSLTVRVSNTTAGESSTAPSNTISVTDPPAGSSSGGLGDVTHVHSTALLGQYMASSFVLPSDGQGGTPITDPQDQQQHLSLPHAG